MQSHGGALPEWGRGPLPGVAARRAAQHGRSEFSRCCVISFSEAGLERVGGGWTPSPKWEARLLLLCSELAGRLAAAEAEAEETARKRQKVEEKGPEEQKQLAERLKAAEAELHAVKEEVVQQKLRNTQLNASLEAAQAASAEKQRELQAAKQQCELLTERLAAAEDAVAGKARELQAAQDEGAAQKERCEQLVRRVEASDKRDQERRGESAKPQSQIEHLSGSLKATTATAARELRAVREELCDQLCRHFSGSKAELQALFEPLVCTLAEGSCGNMANLQALLENAMYKERCEQLRQQLAKAEAKLGQMQVLWEEKGVYKERCRQLERQLAEAKPRATHRITRSVAVAHEDPEEASSSHDSDLTEQLGYILVDDAASISSGSSGSSWFSVQPDCFVPESVFKTRGCGIDFFLMGRDLKKGSQVVAGDDETILEVCEVPEVCHATELVHLQAGAATLRVTKDHPVQVPEDQADKDKEDADKEEIGVGMSCTFVPAGSLKRGDLVMLDSGEPAALTSVDVQPVECDVLKLAFRPNMAVAVFSCPPCILSKGSLTKPKIRRRKMCRRRGQGSPEDLGEESADGGASMPNTAGGEYVD